MLQSRCPHFPPITPRRVLALVGLWLVLALGCSSPPASYPPQPAAPGEDPTQFSGRRAWQHLESLVRIGPRVSGTRRARRARSYLLDQLEAAGVFAEARTHPIEWDGDERDLTHVVGVIPGDSSETLLLAAHYDTHDFDDIRFVGANDGASGPALLLELARVLALESHPYSILFVFLDGESLRPDGTDGREGSQAFAERLRADGAVSLIRLAVFFNGVADADLAIPRDLRSHRIHREIFWDAALSLGHQQAFPEALGFATPAGGHEALLSIGLTPVVAIVDDRFGGPTTPGRFANSERDDLSECRPESLAAVGEVAHEALRRAQRRFVKIDRFVSNPLEGQALQTALEAVATTVQAPPTALRP